ncbi:MAG: aldose 1-epimerase [Pirellulaceae bacterium]|nr:MAG: aldose 1-epimerase [Pirellulaceae bacterium]
MKWFVGCLAIIGLCSLPGWTFAQHTQQAEPPAMHVITETFGQLPDGRTVHRYTLSNRHGTRVQLTDYGAIVTSVETFDKNGQRANINLGFPNLEGYLERHPYFGATVGRFCNRIAFGKFELDGRTYTLATNNGPHHLHGGIHGFDRRLWHARPYQSEEEQGVEFTLRSPDGDEGYPGNLEVTAVYALTDRNELRVEFRAETDRPTILNLTNHNYWNLRGAGNGTILDHELLLEADYYLPVDATLIPTGKVAPVEGTPLDFRNYHRIGARIDQIPADPKGYDHCFVIRGEPGTLRRAARVRERQSGRVLEVHTTQPGIQFYTGNFLSGGPSDGGFPQYGGFCLETQHYPDSPHHPHFPSTVLRPGQKFHEVTLYKFGVE